MPCATDCACSPEVVDLAFRDAEPYIEREIRDRSYQMKRYLVDFAPVKMFPDGIGYTMSKVRFYGDIGPQFDGFDGWRREQRSRPAADGHQDAHDACGYVWEELGHGFEELQYYLMKRDLRTIPICIEDIRTFWEYQQYQNLIFQNLTEITANMREQVNRNAIIGFSVKHVITSDGLEINNTDPYELPNILGVTVGKLNFRILKRLYNALLREAAAFALEVINGRPVFGIMGSDDVFDDLFYESPDVRTDIRESSMVDSLLNRYAFMESIRNMFIIIPDMYAPRYTVDAAGALTRVFPYERDVMIQSGTRPAPNPDYENAPYELVIVITKELFTLRTRKPISTVGGQTDFEAETGMFDWKWHNPERYCDPNRRVGYYFANARIGVEPGDFTDIPAILVARRPALLDPEFWPAAECPPDPVSCDNDLPAQDCPCQQIVGCCEILTDPNVLQFKLNSPLPVGTIVGDDVVIRLANGGTVQGDITDISTDLMNIAVDFSEPVECKPNWYIELACADLGRCSSNVIEDLCLASGDRSVKVAELLITAAAGDDISALLSTGEWITVTIVSIDTDSLTYVVTPGVTLTNECIEKLCVPTALEATCPDCASASTSCDTPNDGGVIPQA